MVSDKCQDKYRLVHPLSAVVRFEDRMARNQTFLGKKVTRHSSHELTSPQKCTRAEHI